MTGGTAAWHARIRCGREVGAGFLVTERLLLTCAHVVVRHGTEPVTVSFPGHRDLGDLTARVVDRGPWREDSDDRGDLVVLELAREVSVRPAVFAPPGAAHRAPELVAYGFPSRLDDGVLATYRAVPGPLIADEWMQLEALTAHGQTLVGGFSGAAVTLRDHSVVGMVVSTTGSHVGRMLPVEVMARYWKGLGDLMPAPRPGPDAGRLETLLRRAERVRPDCDPNRLYASAVDLFAPQPERPFTSLRQAAEYVRTEVPDLAAEDRFADGLQRVLDEWAAGRPLRAPGPRGAAPAADHRFADDQYPGHRLTDERHAGHRSVDDRHPGHPYPADGRTARAHAAGSRHEEPVGRVPRGPVGAPASTPGPSWAPIVVELVRSGAGADQVTVEVSAYRGGHRRPVGTRRLPQDAVRSYVQDRVDEAFNHLDRDAEALITFVLPAEWLNEPVAHWACSAYDSTPLGCAHPLVVAERARHRSGRLRHELTKRWQELDGASGVRLHRVECGTRENSRSLRPRLRDAALAGFAAPPAAVREHFATGLHFPVPVLLWRRSDCPDDDHGHHGDRGGPCAGTAFLDRLTESVDGVPPAELPRRVLDLREEAYAADDPEGHWAREVQLLWDDPRCFSEPAACLHSPVAPLG
ncbi:trypsin-like peptidase domain-containing protein [Streptomyces sp. NPDC090994]|uniref:VMAP-C domain-containing protein n=1 Tax=Streptomyces sp. NPDC090994 TaxID=3365969 RepID=UPI00380C4164